MQLLSVCKDLDVYVDVVRSSTSGLYATRFRSFWAGIVIEIQSHIPLLPFNSVGVLLGLDTEHLPAMCLESQRECVRLAGCTGLDFREGPFYKAYGFEYHRDAWGGKGYESLNKKTPMVRGISHQEFDDFLPLVQSFVMDVIRGVYQWIDLPLLLQLEVFQTWKGDALSVAEFLGGDRWSPDFFPFRLLCSFRQLGSPWNLFTRLSFFGALWNVLVLFRGLGYERTPCVQSVNLTGVEDFARTMAEQEDCVFSAYSSVPYGAYPDLGTCLDTLLGGRREHMERFYRLALE